MKRTLHSKEAGEVSKCVAALRKKSGMTQRQLAAALGVFPSEVHKMETRERRVDAIQLYLWARATGSDPARVARQLYRAFDKMRAKRS